MRMECIGDMQAEDRENYSALWKEIRMNCLVVLASVGMVLLTVCVWTLEAWAWAGGEESVGSRGLRSSSAPA